MSTKEARNHGRGIQGDRPFAGVAGNRVELCGDTESTNKCLGPAIAEARPECAEGTRYFCASLSRSSLSEPGEAVRGTWRRIWRRRRRRWSLCHLCPGEWGPNRMPAPGGVDWREWAACRGCGTGSSQAGHAPQRTYIRIADYAPRSPARLRVGGDLPSKAWYCFAACTAAWNETWLVVITTHMRRRHCPSSIPSPVRRFHYRRGLCRRSGHW